MKRMFPWLKPAIPQGEDIGHRQASWLELFLICLSDFKAIS